MPSKIKIFLFAFWMWTWILFKLTIIANYTLGIIITHLPKYLMPDIKTKTPINIIKAVDQNGIEITNKLQLFINFKWNKNMFDKNGGIDLDIFFTYIGSTVVWVAYVLDYDINNTCAQFIKLINHDNTKTLDTFTEYIKIAVIDTSTKIIHKLKQNNTVEHEDILFGEVNFY